MKKNATTFSSQVKTPEVEKKSHQRNPSRNLATLVKDDADESRRRVSSAQTLQIKKGKSGEHAIRKLEMAELESELVT